MVTLEIDRSARIVRASATGFHSVEEAERYAAEFRVIVALARREFGTVKILLDARGLEVQTPAVIAAFGRLNDIVRGHDDRTAVIASSSLVKRQIFRALEASRERAFLSPEAALEWLMAPEADAADLADAS